MARPWMGVFQGDDAMNGLAVMLCMGLLGVQQTWRTTQEGQLEYVLQVEPTFLASLEQGESITSNLPATAKEVHRLCLRFSAADLRKAPQRNLELPPLATAAERAKKSELDIPAALVVDAQGNSEETTDVSHGWQATNDGRVKYLVQLSPDLLGKLREGDEIYMNLYPEAGQIQQFVVLAGKEVLPRNAVKAHPHATLTAKNHKTVAPAAAETATAAVAGPVAEKSPAAARHVPGIRAPEAPVTPSRPFEPRAGEPARLRNPGRFSVGDDPAEQPMEQPAEQPAEQPGERPLYGNVEDGQPGAAPDLIRENAAEETPREEQSEEPLYGAAKFGPIRSAPPHAVRPHTAPPHVAAAEAPPFDHSQFEQTPFDKGQFASAPIERPKTTPVSAPKATRASLAPRAGNNEYLPESETRHSNSPSRFGAGDSNIATTAGEEDQGDLENPRVASTQPIKERGASFGSGKGKLAKNSPAAGAGGEVPASWSSWVFVCCALFLSIGGNLYLGWTAAEFYSRYRKAIERMRGGEKDSDED
jgi:hypothetical protein